MGMDIRLPIGLLFTLLGVLLVGFGALSDRAIYRVSLGINVNLAWGFVLLLFGGVMLWFGRKTGEANKETSESQADTAHVGRGQA